MMNLVDIGGQPVCEVQHISKEFPGVKALNDVSLVLCAGEIHGLVGANGSGKSTLVKCLSGVYQPDAGQICLGGKTVRLSNPTIARLHGVATIYQEFSLVPTLSVAENIYLGRLPVALRAGIVDWATVRRGAKEILESLGVSVDVDATVGSLSVAEQQIVEIAKAISTDARLIIMDEPTTALGLAETRRLHRLMRRLADQGRAVLYISHRLEDVLDVADRISIMKDGRLVETCSAAETDFERVVRKMVGTEIREYFPKRRNCTDVPLLEVENLTTSKGVNGVSFTIHRGEVFGLAGMLGSGRTEIARALFGVDPVTGGSLRLNGRTVNFRSPRDAIRAGIGLITENRKLHGLFFNFAGPQNISISSLKALLRGMLIDLKRERDLALSYMTKLQIDPLAENRSVQYLSGGNQQKVIIARWLMSQAMLFIMDEPTQGIDVAAKVEVYRLINELTEEGHGVLLISSDYPELLAMSDRIGIVRGGRIVRIVEATEVDQVSLIQMMSNAESGRERVARAG